MIKVEVGNIIISRFVGTVVEITSINGTLAAGVVLSPGSVPKARPVGHVIADIEHDDESWQLLGESRESFIDAFAHHLDTINLTNPVEALAGFGGLS